MATVNRRAVRCDRCGWLWATRLDRVRTCPSCHRRQAMDSRVALGWMDRLDVGEEVCLPWPADIDREAVWTSVYSGARRRGMEFYHWPTRAGLFLRRVR